VATVKDRLYLPRIFDLAWFRRSPEADVITHSDRGSQDCCGLFHDMLKARGQAA
jgi:hypothetical protein